MTSPPHNATPAGPGRYQARELPDGFVLEGGPDRQPVRVRLGPTYWEAEPLWSPAEPEGELERPPFETGLFGSAPYRAPALFGLFEIRRLVTFLAEQAMAPWKPPRSGNALESKLRPWAVRNACRSIGWVVRRQRERLMPAVDSTVRDVQRAVFAACLTAGDLVTYPAFYRHADRYLIADVLRYRAAAVAVRHFGDRILAGQHVAHAPCLDAVHAAEIDVVPAFDEFEYPEPEGEREQTVQLACEQLRNWRTLFSNNGKSYPALNRTLDALPGGLSPRMVCNLRRAHVARPMTDRLELAVLLSAAGAPARRHIRIFQFARRREIVTAMRRVGEALDRPLSPRKIGDVEAFTQFLCDYRERVPADIGINALARRSIQWHREHERFRWQRDSLPAPGQVPDETEVVPPPVAVPEVPGLTFLATAGAIRREAAAMGHCIATYLSEALAGRSFLFHYDAGGESASAEVTRDGRVRQSYGPRNINNAAAAAARRLLAEWARSFPPPPADWLGDPMAGMMEEDDIPF